jgi:hypothetical protein
MFVKTIGLSGIKKKEAQLGSRPNLTLTLPKRISTGKRDEFRIPNYRGIIANAYSESPAPTTTY